MEYFAHTENDSGSWHKLADHLHSVGILAAEFAAQMNPELIEAARWARRAERKTDNETNL